MITALAAALTWTAAAAAAAPAAPAWWVAVPTALAATSAAADAGGAPEPAARLLARGERVELVGADDLAVEVTAPGGRRGWVRRDRLWPADGATLATVLAPAALRAGPAADAAPLRELPAGAVLLVLPAPSPTPAPEPAPGAAPPADAARVLDDGPRGGWVPAPALARGEADLAAAVLLGQARRAAAAGDPDRAAEAAEAAARFAAGSPLAPLVAAAAGRPWPLPPRDEPWPAGAPPVRVLEAEVSGGALRVTLPEGEVDWRALAAQHLKRFDPAGPVPAALLRPPDDLSDGPTFAFQAPVPAALARGRWYALAPGGVAELTPAELAGALQVQTDGEAREVGRRYAGALVLKGALPSSRGAAFVLWSPQPLRTSAAPLGALGGAVRLLPEEAEAARALAAERAPVTMRVIEAQPGGWRWLLVAFRPGDGDGCEFHDALYLLTPALQRVAHAVYGCEG